MSRLVYYRKEIFYVPYNPQPTAFELSHSYTLLKWTSPVYVAATNKLIYSPRCFDPLEGHPYNTPSNNFLVFDLNTNTASTVPISETPPNIYGWRLAPGDIHKNGKIYYPMATGIDKWVVLDPFDMSYEMFTTFQLSNGLVDTPVISDNSQMVSCGVSSLSGEVFFVPTGSAFSKIMKINLNGKLENVADVPENRKFYDGGMIKDGSIVFKEHTQISSKVLRIIPYPFSASYLPYDIRSSYPANSESYVLFYLSFVSSSTNNTFTFGKNGNGQYIEICDPLQKVQVPCTIWATGSGWETENGYNVAIAPNDLAVWFPGYTGLNNNRFCDYDFSLGFGGTCVNPGTAKYGSRSVGGYWGNRKPIPGKVVFFESSGVLKFYVYTYTELW